MTVFKTAGGPVSHVIIMFSGVHINVVRAATGTAARYIKEI